MNDIKLKGEMSKSRILKIDLRFLFALMPHSILVYLDT